MRYKKIIFFFVLISCFLLIHYFGMSNYLSLDQFKKNHNFFTSMVSNHYKYSVFLYFLVYVGAVACAFPSSSVLTLIGGYLFGGIPGAVYSTLAATVGASLLFLHVRYFFGGNFQKKYAQRLYHFNQSVRRDGISYLLFVRLIAVIPFVLVNICAGLSQVSFVDFVWTTALGIIPATVIFSFMGKELQSINSFKDIFSINLALIFLFLGLLALIPLMVKKINRV